MGIKRTWIRTVVAGMVAGVDLAEADSILEGEGSVSSLGVMRRGSLGTRRGFEGR